MNSYTNRLASYYDLMYSNKNYAVECDLIKKYSKKDGTLLDIGAGTLSHSIILSEYFSKITATDFSKEMLKVGEQKIKTKGIKNISTHCGDLDGIIKLGKYDTVISMFNVVNHIVTLEDLLLFIHKVSNNLKTNGYFIFDCWNGVSSIIDPPTKTVNKLFFQDNNTVSVRTETETNFKDLICNMNSTVNVYNDIEQLETFSYGLTHKLWSADLLKEILKISNYEVKIIPYYNDYIEYGLSDHRLTFICKKIEKWNEFILK